MSDENEWVWQGWLGPMADAVVGKALTDADPRVGVWVPLPGEPPANVDVAGTTGMFAVQTRRNDPITTPAGMIEAEPSLVGRMVGA